MPGFDISFRSNIKEVQKKMDRIERKALDRVTVRALNKTGRTINKEAVKRIGQETGLTAKRIRSKLKIRKAGRNRYAWSLVGLRADTNIIEWVTKSKQAVGAFKKRPGVKSRAWKKSKTYPGTFIGRGRTSGKLLVFVRDPSKPSGVRSVHGPNIRVAFVKILDELERIARRRFNVVFEQEMGFEISKNFNR